jgi:hypothetical protein
MVACHKTYDCMVMSEVDRDCILSCGPARFQLLSAYHPGITGGLVENFGRKLSTSFPRNLFDTIMKLEVVRAYLTHFNCDDMMVLTKTNKLLGFCRA